MTIQNENQDKIIRKFSFDKSYQRTLKASSALINEYSFHIAVSKRTIEL